MLLGLVGKPNSGKSSFFAGATLVDVEIANRPFTTINPNKGVTYVRQKCPHVDFGLKECNPRNSKCEGGVRLIPINIIDVAGLVPDAHLGKGRGNAFLSDLNQADAFIQVVDVSGRTDLYGNESEQSDPGDEIEFLEKEITYWIMGIVKKNWGKVRGKNIDSLAEMLSGLRLTKQRIEAIADKLKLAKERLAWTDEEMLSFADEARKMTKPIVIAANKFDVPGAAENLAKLRERFPDMLIIPTCAPAEIALRKAAQKGVIKYTPGDKTFELSEAAASSLDEKQKAGIASLKKIIESNEFGTGVQKVIDATVFEYLGLVAVYPVEDEHKFSNNFGHVLPDTFLVPKGTTALEFAGKIHTDLAERFIGAINARTRMRVGKDYLVQNGDVLKIIAGGK